MGKWLGGSDAENIKAAKDGLKSEQNVLSDPGESLANKDRAGTQASIWRGVLDKYGK